MVWMRDGSAARLEERGKWRGTASACASAVRAVLCDGMTRMEREAERPE